MANSETTHKATYPLALPSPELGSVPISLIAVKTVLNSGFSCLEETAAGCVYFKKSAAE